LLVNNRASLFKVILVKIYNLDYVCTEAL